MGHIYPYHCGHCGFEQRFYHGHGYLIHSQTVRDYLNQHTVLFHYKVHEMLKEMDKKFSNLFIKSGFQVYKCPRCKLLFDKVEVTVYNEKSIIHRNSFRCNECGTRLKLTNIHRIKKTICPNCHKKEFTPYHVSHQLWE